MNGQLITGIIFLAGLLVFLFVAYFVPPKTAGQDRILRFVSTVCAGCAGAILPGGINIQGSLQWSNATTISLRAFGALGFAVLIWLTWRTDKGQPPPPPGVKVTFPDGTSFARAAELVSQLAKEHVVLEGFSQSQEQQPLKSLYLQATTVKEAFERLGSYTGLKEFPTYTVTHTDGQYTLKA